LGIQGGIPKAKMAAALKSTRVEIFVSSVTVKGFTSQQNALFKPLSVKSASTVGMSRTVGMMEIGK
jgi:hypothetical protein